MRRFSQSSKNLDLSVIIVSFNTSKLTLQCIKSVLNSVNNLRYEIIVIDNASTDGTLRQIRKSKIKNQNEKVKIKIIENKENLGFAKANNQGIKIASGRYILLLNSDTVVKKNSVENLIKFAENTPDAGAVGVRLLNPDGTIQPSVFFLPTIWRAVKQYWLGEEGLLDKYAPDGNSPTEVESLVMAAFLITPKALENVGLLNERYFMYFEDLDYCRRIKVNNLKIYYLPTSEIVHQHGASGKKVGDKKQFERLNQSSKIYHGLIRNSLFNFILWSGQKWQQFLKK